jgi:hypothetical protein
MRPRERSQDHNRGKPAEKRHRHRRYVDGAAADICLPEQRCRRQQQIGFAPRAETSFDASRLSHACPRIIRDRFAVARATGIPADGRRRLRNPASSDAVATQAAPPPRPRSPPPPRSSHRCSPRPSSRVCPLPGTRFAAPRSWAPPTPSRSRNLRKSAPRKAPLVVVRDAGSSTHCRRGALVRARSEGRVAAGLGNPSPRPLLAAQDLVSQRLATLYPCRAANATCWWSRRRRPTAWHLDYLAAFTFFLKHGTRLDVDALRAQLALAGYQP